MLDADFGKAGTPFRDEFDKETEAFCLAQTLREERIRAGLTQQQLAEKIGTKKTYISHLENGKADVQLSTLFRILRDLAVVFVFRFYKFIHFLSTTIGKAASTRRTKTMMDMMTGMMVAGTKGSFDKEN